VSRGEGELLTVPKPRAVSLFSVYLAVKPVGKPDAGNRLVRFDERGWETERCRMAQATAPILDSTNSDVSGRQLKSRASASFSPSVWSLSYNRNRFFPRLK
jgi:hypothetical protein